MRSQTIRVRTREGLVDYTGWPCGVDGLAVVEARDGDLNCTGKQAWSIVHVRSGLVMSTCHESPESALDVATTLASFADFTRSAVELRGDRDLVVGVVRLRGLGKLHHHGAAAMSADLEDVACS